ncbi:hypothetical protein [Tahibacter soli]|uniref:Uncharacterized protein n=1 Tax=Tahibacter soli TaxID=2983605 RepID=A0A9X3YJB3_9GAMM|nr:hypothetical protein [Tahibacter soli]MDC8012265.1 hypothetical protein [Tahibacter soli]
MNLTTNRPAASTANAANARMYAALDLVAAELSRIGNRTTVVAVEIDGERPVLTVERPIDVPGSHYITRNVDGRRLSLWVAEEGGCKLECAATQPVPSYAGRR